MNRIVRKPGLAVVLAGVLSIGAYAQEAAEEENAPATGKDVMRPTDVGLRFTPGMARVISRMIAKEALGRQYGLDEDAQGKAADRIARQLMDMAHKNAGQGQKFFEFAVESLLENHGRFTPESGKRWAELSKPMLPSIREFMNKTAEDLRPLIPPARQMQFAGDMMKASLGIDLYEKKMERWAQGKVTAGENPFDERIEETPAESRPGETREVADARRQAEGSVKWESTRRWRQLVDSAISYYRLDETQKKSAESMLREMEDRAKQVCNDEWRARIVLNRTKLNLSHRGMQLWNTPWMWQIDREYEDLLKPVRELTRELQDRLETLPTESQRQAAAARVAEGFEKVGFKE